MNCITYALHQSGKFEEKTIDNIKVSSFSRYVSHKDLDKLGDNSNIAFKVIKLRSDTDKMQEITRGRKIIGSSSKDATLIELALIDKHYILNERVDCVSSYALLHYKQIKQDCPNKPEEWILKVSRRRGNTYEIDSRSHIKSYELVKIATSNRIAFNYEELEKLPTALYDLANSHIKKHCFI